MADALDEMQIDVKETTPTDWGAFNLEIDSATAPVVVDAPAPAAPSPEPAPATPAAGDDLTVLKRVRLDRLSEENQLAISILAKNEDMSLEDAARLARQRLGIQDPTTPQAHEPAPIHNDDEPAAPGNDLVSQLEEVDRQLDELANEGGTGSIYDPTVNALNRTRSELIAKIEYQKLSDQAQQQNQQAAEDAQFAEAAAAAEDAAMAAFGDHLNNPDDPLAQAVTSHIATLAAIHDMVLAGDTRPLDDPDTAIAYAEFRHPDFAKRLTFAEAARLGIQPKTAGVSAAAPTVKPVGQPSFTPPGAAPAMPRLAPISGGQGNARVEIAPADPADAWKAGLDKVQDGDWSAFDQGLSQTAGGYAAVRIV
jgi:hypothetical protein